MSGERPSPPEVLYAKHRLLAEIGPEGQDALCGASFAAEPSAHHGAGAVAIAYLERSGATCDASGPALAFTHATPPADVALEHAWAALAGALAATEKVREVVRIQGRPLGWPEELFGEVAR